MTQLASHVLAADANNTLNAGTSWLDPESWERKLGNAGKFITTSLLSGANSFYNTAATVGSWVDPTIEQRDTDKWITSLDSDWGQYYRANKQAVDITGFVVSSIIPGLAGAKLFNMGQAVLKTGIATGKISGNMAKATGLLVTNKAKYLDESAELIKGSLAAQNTLNINTYKALASGAYQNTLEAAAGELMILATLGQSPVLDDASTWDIVKNVAIGGAFGGVIGGGIEAAKSIGWLRRVRDTEDLARQPWLRRTELAAATAPADRAILIADDLESLATPIKRSLPENASAAEIAAVEKEAKVTRDLWESRVTKDLGDIRTSMHDLAGSNSTHANMLADLLTPVRTEEGLLTPGFSRSAYENLSGAAGITRMGQEHTLEIAARKAAKEIVEAPPPAKGFVRVYHGGTGINQSGAELWVSRGQQYAKGYANKSGKAGKVFYVDLPATDPRIAGDAEFGVLGPYNFQLTKAETANLRLLKAGKEPEIPIATRYVKLTGDDAGAVMESAPRVLGIGDLYPSKEAIAKVASSKKFSSKKPLDYATLQGADAHTIAQLRQVWANNVTLKEGMQIHANDLALLTKAYEEGFTNIKIVKGDGPTLDVLVPSTKEDIYRAIKEAKMEVATAQIKAGKALNYSGDEILARAAMIADVKPSWLQGNQAANEFDDLFATAHDAVKYQEFLTKRGLSVDTDAPLYKPQYAKVVYAIDKRLTETHEHMADAIVYMKAQQQVFVEGARRVTAKGLGQYFNQLPDITEKELLRANSRGAGATLLAGANSGYGTLGSVTTQVGKVTAEVSQKFVKDATDTITPALQQLAGKAEAALEFSAVNQKLQRSDRLFVMATSESGAKGLVDHALVEELKKAKGFSGLVPDNLLDKQNWIGIKSEEVWNAWESLGKVTGRNTQLTNEIRAAQGLAANKFEDVVRPIRKHPRDYPYFAFVYDPRINNSGHVAMVHAASEKELAELIDKVPTHFKVTTTPELAGKIKVRTKLEVENYYKARNEYEYDRTLNENYINSELASKGVYSDYFPQTDPQRIVDSVVQQVSRQERLQAQELIRLHYQPTFDMLEDMGKEYSKFTTSKFASRAELLERTSDNPYFNYIKSALNISNLSESHLVYGFNKMLDEAASKAWGAITKASEGVKKPEDLALVNKVLQEQGIMPVPYDAALDALANHSAPRGVLTQFVQKANAMLSTVTIGIDPLSAINNAIGSNLLRMTELNSVLRAIKGGNAELAGELSSLAKVKLPGVDAEMLAPTKLVAQAIDNLFKKPELLKKYKDMGLIKDRVEQLHLLVDDFTLKGTETVAEIAKMEGSAFQKFKALTGKAAEKGEQLTGNKFVEEANRFISANVMDQITTLAVKHGLMDSKTAQAYINTFVNRVEGSILASQRPLLFQGPIGQAVGLFQRYQFNLLQQMFRYVSEGTKKDAAMLLGLQGTLYGLQSLPGFQFINTHIVGTMSGNPEHRDAYSYAYSTMGTGVADFLMYGLPSNILQNNLYTRGDINPRHLTVIPTNLQEVPLIQGWGKFFGSIFETASKIRQGADVTESILQGIEHNGISRPLAGMAQVMQAAGPKGQVYSTQNNGSILYSNDLVSWASVMRLAGGRPLDEARTNDALWRTKVYEASRAEKMKGLRENVKTTLIQGNEPDEDQLQSFAEKYAQLGGKQERFNSWMLKIYKDANVPQAEQIRDSLTSPFAQHMQLLMGGDELE